MMSMASRPVEYFPIASACNQVEAIRIQMLLDRARLPYRMRGENLYHIYGNVAATLAGPLQFLIPKELKEQAEECLLELFTLDPSNLPHQCPACETQVPHGAYDCPGCGLFLG